MLFRSTAGEKAIASAPNRLTTIRDLLERDAVCRAIVQYLVRHSEAADTARGIAEWWINRDLPSTLDALVKLVDSGIVCSYPVQDETLVFGYTKNPILRQTLAQHVERLSRAPSPASRT